jgi:uncharacterized membrane protein YccC
MSRSIARDIFVLPANLWRRWIPSLTFDHGAGWRAAFAVSVLLWLGHERHDPLFAWAAIGAFWTCLVDPAGTRRRRLASMLAFALVSAICGGLMAYVAGSGTAPSALALFGACLLAGLASTRSAATYQVAILSATACVVMIDLPHHDAPHVLHLLLTYLLGCALSVLIAVSAWVWPAATRISVSHPKMAERDIATRHALRLALATTAAFLAVRCLQLPFGYWATMATLLILQPNRNASLPRMAERALGTALGAMIASAIGLLIHSPTGLVLAAFPLVGLAIAVRRINYALFVVFLTPSFVLITDFALPASEVSYAMTRLGNNLLGCLVAFIAMQIVWPREAAERV